MPEPTTPPLNSPHGRAHDARLPAVLVVIPSFNCAPLLPRSVHSAYALRGCAPRVVVVDDGSTDDTPEVLRTLQLEHPDLVVLRKPNGGLSSARNHGIAYGAANGLGDYLLLLDADDVLLPVDLGPLLAGGHDMVRIGVEEVVEGEQARMQHVEALAPMSGRDYLHSRFLAGNFYTPSWAYLYRSAWLHSACLKFVDGLLHEDNLFTVQALMQAGSVRAVPELVYRYIRRAGSITLARGDDKVERRVSAYVDIARRLTVMANADPSFDLRWKIHEVLDGAHHLAAQCATRRAHWQVLIGLLRVMATYRGTGRHGLRYAQRARLKRYAGGLMARRKAPGRDPWGAAG